MELNENKIIEYLQELGFTKNDSKVYMALLQMEDGTPAKISRITGIERPRVYDALKRLEKFGYIIKDSARRPPTYHAKSPSEVMNKIMEKYKKKVEIARTLKNHLNIIKKSKKPVLQILGKHEQILEVIEDIVNKAEERVSLVITPDIYFEKEFFERIYNFLIRKRLGNSEIDINVYLPAQPLPTDFRWNRIKDMVKRGISVKGKKSASIIPLGIYLSEKSFMFTLLTSTRTIPSYEYGITIENPSPGIILGFEHLLLWLKERDEYGQAKIK